MTADKWWISRTFPSPRADANGARVGVARPARASRVPIATIS
jgi:hypothetical protein